MLKENDRIVYEFELSVIPESGSITEQQRTFRKIVQHLEIEDTNDELDEALLDGELVEPPSPTRWTWTRKA